MSAGKISTRVSLVHMRCHGCRLPSLQRALLQWNGDGGLSALRSLGMVIASLRFQGRLSFARIRLISRSSCCFPFDTETAVSNTWRSLSAHWQARSVIFIGLHSLLIPEGHGGVPFLRVTFANVAKRPSLLVELRRASFSLLQQSCHVYLDSRATSRFFRSDLLTARSRRALPLAVNFTFPIPSYSCNNAHLSAGR